MSFQFPTLAMFISPFLSYSCQSLHIILLKRLRHSSHGLRALKKLPFLSRFHSSQSSFFDEEMDMLHEAASKQPPRFFLPPDSWPVPTRVLALSITLESLLQCSLSESSSSPPPLPPPSSLAAIPPPPPPSPPSPLVLLRPTRWKPNGREVAVLYLEGDEARHAVRSLRLSRGAVIEICDGHGVVARGVVESWDPRRDRLSMRVDSLSYFPPSFCAVYDDVQHPYSSVLGAPKVPIWTVVAVASTTLKGGREDWLLEKSTELGADEFIPLLTERSGGIRFSPLPSSFSSFPLPPSFHALNAPNPKAALSKEPDPPAARSTRKAAAAMLQSLRPHLPFLPPPLPLIHLLPSVAEAAAAVVFAAGAPGLMQVLGGEMRRRGRREMRRGGWGIGEETEGIYEEEKEGMVQGARTANHHSLPAMEEEEFTSAAVEALAALGIDASVNLVVSSNNTVSSRKAVSSNKAVSLMCTSSPPRVGAPGRRYDSPLVREALALALRRLGLSSSSGLEAGLEAGLQSGLQSGLSSGSKPEAKSESETSGRPVVRATYQNKRNSNSNNNNNVGINSTMALQLRNQRMQRSVILIIGPEGDFTPAEIRGLREAGAKAAGLTQTRLRTETAALAALATATLMLRS